MPKRSSTKVLLVINELDWFWSHRLPLASAILDNEWELVVAAHDATLDHRLSAMGIEPCNLPRIGKFYNPFAYLNFIISFVRTIRRVKPDVIHTITLKYALYSGLIARCTRTKPVIFTIAGLGSLFSSSSTRIKLLRIVSIPIMKFAFGGRQNYIIFQNPDDRDIMITAGILAERNTTLIRGSGVDLEAYPYIPYEETNDPPIILFASRLLRDKGILDFIEAAKIIKGMGIEARFLVAGDLKDDNPRFIDRRDIEEAQEQGFVEWIGKIPNIQQLLEQSMLFVFPSYYGEGVPKVLLEAASTGRALITCDVPGCREVVEHGINGVLIPPKNPAQLASELKDLILDAEKREKYGRQSRKLVEENFHSDLVAGKTIEVYNRALGDSRT